MASNISIERTLKIKKNIYYGFLIKGLSIFISFLMFRITYIFLGSKEEYGVWLTILTVLTWITIFDFGIGNGLRNQLSNKLAVKNIKDAKILVSTTYIFMTIIIFFLLLIYFIVQSWINWERIFNYSGNLNLNIAMSIIVGFYLLNFIGGLISSIAFANQNAIYPGLFTLLGNIVILITLTILYVVDFRSLNIIAAVFGFTNFLVFLIANITLFKTKYYSIKPSFYFIDFSYSKSVLNLGIKFFILQIMSIVIFTTDNMIIAHALGPSYVSEFQVVFKLFSAFTMISSIIMAPLWSAYTDAYAINDIDWIKRILNKLILMIIPLSLAILVVYFLNEKIITIWMGEQFVPSKKLAFLLAIYALVNIWFSIFAYLLNGINKTSIQLIAVVIGGIINIPLSLYFVSLGWGIEGVVLGTICSLLIFCIVGPIEVYYRIYVEKRYT